MDGTRPVEAMPASLIYAILVEGAPAAVYHTRDVAFAVIVAA